MHIRLLHAALKYQVGRVGRGGLGCKGKGSTGVGGEGGEGGGEGREGRERETKGAAWYKATQCDTECVSIMLTACHRLMQTVSFE